MCSSDLLELELDKGLELEPELGLELEIELGLELGLELKIELELEISSSTMSTMPPSSGSSEIFFCLLLHDSMKLFKNASFSSLIGG